MQTQEIFFSRSVTIRKTIHFSKRTTSGKYSYRWSED